MLILLSLNAIIKQDMLKDVTKAELKLTYKPCIKFYI
jgi:hypothetical protein